MHQQNEMMVRKERSLSAPPFFVQSHCSTIALQPVVIQDRFEENE